MISIVMRDKLEIFPSEGKFLNFLSLRKKLEIKSPSENKRNRGNHGIMHLNKNDKRH